MRERTPGVGIKHRFPLATAAAVALLVIGCNLFEPLHTPGSSDNVEDLMSDTNDALDRGEYENALKYMDKAMSIDPQNPRVRYLHSVATVKFHHIDMLDVLGILQPAEGGTPVDVTGERVLLMSDAELESLFKAFKVVSVDLEPLVAEMTSTGREIPNFRQSDDLLLSYGVSETIVGMLRVLDNDDTADDFTVDDRLIIAKKPGAYHISVDDLLLSPGERDYVVDLAIERAWDRFVKGRHAFFCYYQFVINEVIWTETASPPPASLPEAVDDGTTVGEMVAFIDDGVMALYEEKEDL